MAKVGLVGMDIAMQLVDVSDPIDLTWIGGFFKDEKAIPLAELAIKDFGFCLPFFVQLSFQDSKQNPFWKTYLTSQGFRRPISFVGSYTRNCLKMKS